MLKEGDWVCLEVSFLNLMREIVRFLFLLCLEFVDEFDVEILLGRHINV